MESTKCTCLQRVGGFGERDCMVVGLGLGVGDVSVVCFALLGFGGTPRHGFKQFRETDSNGSQCGFCHGL